MRPSIALVRVQLGLAEGGPIGIPASRAATVCPVLALRCANNFQILKYHSCDSAVAVLIRKSSF